MSLASWIFIVIVIATVVFAWRGSRGPLDLGAVSRIAIYGQTMLFLLGLAAVCVLVIYKDGQVLSYFGMDRTRFTKETGIGCLVGIGLAALITGLEHLLRIGESDLVKFVIPRTAREVALFVLLSACAGFSEELIFRGFLIDRFSALTGILWVAVLASSVLFALSHSYQGWSGALRSGLIGVVLAAVYLWTESLWVVMVAHFSYDVVAALLIARVLTCISHQDTGCNLQDRGPRGRAEG